MPRRTLHDPLQPLDRPTWLVIRNVHNQALEWRPIEAGANLRGILTEMRKLHVADGWMCEDICRACSFFFAQRGAVRLFVGIERYDPTGPGHDSHREPRRNE